jgi:CRISPR type III-A-associated protein Csm2
MNRHQDRRPPPHRPHPQRQAPTLSHVGQLWPEYLQGGYFDTEGNLRLEYVTRERLEPLARAMADAHDKPLTINQVRRFFQHCRRIEAQLSAGEATWPEVAPKIVFLDAAAQYAYGKEPRKIPALFKDFIRRNIAAVGNANDFGRGFLPHFEALVGFGSGYIKRERN